MAAAALVPASLAGSLGKIGNNLSPPPTTPPTPAAPESGPTTWFRGDYPAFIAALKGRAIRAAKAMPAEDLSPGREGGITNDGMRRQMTRLGQIRRWAYMQTASNAMELDPWLLRLAGCRHVAHGGSVSVMGVWQPGQPRGEAPTSAHLGGVVTCGSVWSCPSCCETIKSERRDEIRQAVDWARRQGLRVSMLTLSVAHGSSADARTYLAGVRTAFSKVLGGAAWQRWRTRWTVRHFVSALETTDGRNGWHPHLHTLLIHDGELPEEARARLAERWSDAVASELGELARPRQDSVGCNLRECDPHEPGDYLSKMGLDLGFELSASSTKDARSCLNWSVWDLLRWAPLDDWARDRWLDWTRASKGRKFLTWSRGFRKAVGLGKKSDEEAAATPEEAKARDGIEPEIRQIGLLTIAEFRALRDVADGLPCVVEQYREYGVEAGRARVAEIVGLLGVDPERDEWTPTPEQEHPPRWYVGPPPE